ncbi:MAG: hypothetical protein ACTTJ7_05090 [Treponema sp.]
MNIQRIVLCIALISYAAPAMGIAKQAKANSFTSIEAKTLTLAEGAKWYYKVFDDYGRPSFSVLYENGKELETVVWQYDSLSAHPSEQIVTTDTDTQKTTYTAAGKISSIATYDKENTLLTKIENTYDSAENLIAQTTTEGEITERSEWRFIHDTAVSQTKYYNGKKTAFIELHNNKRIVHIYKDDKEVLVTEEE